MNMSTYARPCTGVIQGSLRERETTEEPRSTETDATCRATQQRQRRRGEAGSTREGACVQAARPAGAGQAGRRAGGQAQVGRRAGAQACRRAGGQAREPRAWTRGRSTVEGAPSKALSRKK